MRGVGREFHNDESRIAIHKSGAGLICINICNYNCIHVA
jgi:hypothetical protein